MDVRRLYITLAFVVVALTTLTSSAQELVRVTRVVDGDTIILESGERVRLLGVNAPQHSKTKTQFFGKEATDFTKRMVEGKLVRVEENQLANRQDKSRTLAYVFLADGTFLNAEIIRHGYGFAVPTTPPLKYDYEFRRLEQEARQQRRGLWAEVRKEDR